MFICEENTNRNLEWQAQLTRQGQVEFVSPIIRYFLGVPFGCSAIPYAAMLNFCSTFVESRAGLGTFELEFDTGWTTSAHLEVDNWHLTFVVEVVFSNVCFTWVAEQVLVLNLDNSALKTSTTNSRYESSFLVGFRLQRGKLKALLDSE